MSHAKIGRFSKKQIFELPDGTHRLEPHLYVRVRGNGRYRNYFFFAISILKAASAI